MTGTPVSAGRVRRIADSLPSRPVGMGVWVMFGAALVCVLSLLVAGEGLVAVVHGVAGISRASGFAYIAGGLAVAVPSAYVEALGWSNFVRERARRRLVAALAFSAALAAVIGLVSLLESIVPSDGGSGGSSGSGVSDGGRRRRRGSATPVTTAQPRLPRSNFATELVTTEEMAKLLGVPDAWVGASVPDTPTWSAAQAGPVAEGRRRATPKVHLVVRQPRTSPAKRYEGLCRRGHGEVPGIGDRACRVRSGLLVLVDDTLVHLRLVSRGGPTEAQSEAMIAVLGAVVERLRSPGW
jgi:hypothetical protein